MEEPDPGIDNNYVVNESDGLHPSDILHLESQSDSDLFVMSEGIDDFEPSNTTDPNSVIIVTNLIEDAFTSSYAKTKFEAMFLKYDSMVQFQYLKSFRRVRVVFSSVEYAKEAHEGLNNSMILGQPFRCYFAQPAALSSDMVGHRDLLEPPPREKQFLLSPPPSPPPGWEVINERKPAINYDLIAAMARMGPGESYEVHSGNGTHPSIVVHICEDPEGYAERPSKIPQTRRPDRNP